jgi:signal transduction histidine kinase
VQDFLTKPFCADELRARVTNLIAVKRARDVLRQALASRDHDVEALARELGRRKRDLETALAAAEVARDHAERASETKATFLRLVSHELRTPLTALQTYLHVLARDRAVLAPEHDRIVRRMTSASRRLLTVVESVLEQARIASGRLAIQVGEGDLVVLATAVVEDARAQAEGKPVTVSLSVAPGLPPLVSDYRLVALILANLVSNAVKFTPQGTVHVSLAYEDGAHRLEVRDSGPGIPAEEQAAVFEPFTQLEPMRHKHTPGVGLGLALVREMVRALGGRIELRSEVAAGSTFTVVLPPPAPHALQASA